MQRAFRDGDLSLYRQVEKQIMTMLDTGVLKPGDRLPSLRRMSVKVDVSLSTIHQAYLELEKKGVIAARPRSGFYVRSSFRQPPPPDTRPRADLSPQPVKRAELIQMVVKAVEDPAILPLGLAYPEDRLLPVDALGRMTSSLLRYHPARALHYEKLQGNEELRKQISFRSIDSGAFVDPQDLIVTSGALEAVHVALRVLTRPGDNVLVQSPCYFGFLQLLENMGLNAVEVRCAPEHGVMLSDVHDAVARLHVRAALLTPNFSNPDGSLTPNEVKKELVAFLNEHDIPLVEDDIYGDIHFGPGRPESCRTYDRKGLVLQCASFSKTLAPGYRVGWLAPGRFYDQALLVKTNINTTTTTITQMVIAEYLRAGRYDHHLKKLRRNIERQVQTMQTAVRRYFPNGIKVTRPQGGMVLWIELPKPVDSKALFLQAKQMNIGLAPGIIFSSQNRFNHYIRLGCGNIWSDHIELGIKRLGDLAADLGAKAA